MYDLMCTCFGLAITLPEEPEPGLRASCCAQVRPVTLLSASSSPAFSQHQVYSVSWITSHSLSEPLSVKYIFRKHPVHGLFYQNWNAMDLQDGDVLMVQHHDEFFTAANDGARQCSRLRICRLR
jgi:hypothetical protein